MKSNWIVTAIAPVPCGALLWAWFALGFDHVDDPLGLVVAVVWWLAVAAVRQRCDERATAMGNACVGKRDVPVT